MGSQHETAQPIQWKGAKDVWSEGWGCPPNKKSPSLVQVPDQSQCLDPGPLIDARLYVQEAEPYNITQQYVVLGLPVLYQRDLLGQLKWTLNVVQEFWWPAGKVLVDIGT